MREHYNSNQSLNCAEGNTRVILGLLFGTVPGNVGIIGSAKLSTLFGKFHRTVLRRTFLRRSVHRRNFHSRSVLHRSVRFPIMTQRSNSKPYQNSGSNPTSYPDTNLYSNVVKPINSKYKTNFNECHVT